MSELTPVQRVFGVSAESGPFDVLGLTPEPTPAEQVRAAASRRLQRLASGTFDPLDVVAAQEAVAAAEAQLLNSDVQRAWLQLHQRSRSCARSLTTDEGIWTPAVRVALARAGGWNRRSAAHIGAIAVTAGAHPADLIRAATRRQPVQATPPVQTSAPPPVSAAPEVFATPIGLTLVGAIGAFAASFLVLIALIAARPAPKESPTTAKPAPVVSVDPPDIAAFEPLLPSAETTMEALLDAMNGAVAGLSASPADAAWRMEEALLAFASRWTEADEAERDRAIRLAGDFLMQAAPGGGASRRVATAVASPLGEAPPSPPTRSSARAHVWASGVVGVLASTASLAPETIEALGAPSSSAPGSFDSGARTALREVAIAVSRAPEADPGVWDAWIEMLDIVTPGRALARQRQTMTLDAIETLLLSPAPPSRSRASLHAVELLLARSGLDGSRAPVARDRLIAWLGDPRVASIDFAILMRASQRPELATRELGPSASADARSALRDELLAAWGMATQASPSERLAEQWRSAAVRVARMPANAPGARIERAVASARLAGAASLAWEGEVIRAGEILGAAHRVDVPSANPAREHAPGSDGRWTVEYHSVRRNTDAAMDALDRVSRAGELGPIDARTLARLALLGSPPQVRQRAQQLASDRADEVNLVEALLETLPRAPRTPRVSDLLGDIVGASLGNPRDDAWMLRSRRALVARALDLMGPNDPPARADALQRALRDAFDGAPSVAISTPPDAATAIASATDALLKSAAGAGVTTALDADEVRRRRDGRRRVAEGPIQLTAAEALAMAETLHVLVRHERPARAPEADRVLRDLTLRQQRARGVFEQIDAAMGACAELWTIRLDYPRRASVGVVHPLPVGAWHIVFASAAISPEETDARLSALDPADPRAYLRLAEEIAYEAEDPDDIALARRLALLAASAVADDPARAGVAASACLLLADLSTDAQRRAWLRALADSFGARDGLLAWRTEIERDYEARLSAAETLALARAEDNRRAHQHYERPEVRRALERYASAIPGGLDTLEHRITHAPSCPECKNERVVRSVSNPNDWVLCHTCRGRPSPSLTRDELVTSLRVERALLGDTDDWSVALVAIGYEPLRDLTLEEAAQRYDVDLERTVYRDGRWVSP